MSKAGRPLELDTEISAEICSKLADGWSLVEICKASHMPGRSTVHMWLMKADAYRKADRETDNEYTRFLDSYARAREIQADNLIDEILEIADDGRNDWVERENARTGSTWVELDKEAVMRSKLRVDARFRVAERLYPKKYGAKADLTLKTDPDAPPVYTLKIDNG